MSAFSLSTKCKFSLSPLLDCLPVTDWQPSQCVCHLVFAPWVYLWVCVCQISADFCSCKFVVLTFFLCSSWLHTCSCSQQILACISHFSMPASNPPEWLQNTRNKHKMCYQSQMKRSASLLCLCVYYKAGQCKKYNNNLNSSKTVFFTCCSLCHFLFSIYL